MKKIVILAISAILAANICAQEQKKECKQLTKEERLEFEIKRLTNELMLSDAQVEKFAVTYREYASQLGALFEKSECKQKFEPGKVLTDAELDKMAKQRFQNFKELADLQLKYYDKFRKDLSARQVERILRLEGPCDGKKFDKQCCGKQFDGKQFDGKQFDGKHFEGKPFDGKPFDGPKK